MKGLRLLLIPMVGYLDTCEINVNPENLFVLLVRVRVEVKITVRLERG